MGTYTLDMLAKLAGVTPRTVRYYVAQGLLPAPEFAGPGTRYDESHHWLLQQIRRMQADHLPLAEIRDRLRKLGTADIQRLASSPERPAETPNDALDYIQQVLRRPVQTADDHMPMAALARQLTPAADMAPAPVEPPPSPEPAERSQWERIALDPDIELHIRRPLTRIKNRRVDRLIGLARELLEEDD